jgi:hypothetical protein
VLSEFGNGRFPRVTGNFLLASMVVSSIGIGPFLYGKKQKRAPHLVVGVLLMAFPYFVSNIPLMFAIAGALLGLLYLASYLGL